MSGKYTLVGEFFFGESTILIKCVYSDILAINMLTSATLPKLNDN